MFKKKVLSIVQFEEEERFLCYCPSLDLLQEGKTKRKAKNNLCKAIAAYLSESLDVEMLLALGWTIEEEKGCTPPTFSNMVLNNRVLRNILDSRILSINIYSMMTE